METPAWRIEAVVQQFNQTTLTMKQRFPWERTLAGLSAAVGLLVTAAPKMADGQIPEEPAQTVPVEIDPMIISTTGLTIPQSEAATSLPVSTYSEEAIRSTGATTVTQFLQTIPQNTGARFRETVG